LGQESSLKLYYILQGKFMQSDSNPSLMYITSI